MINDFCPFNSARWTNEERTALSVVMGGQVHMVPKGSSMFEEVLGWAQRHRSGGVPALVIDDPYPPVSGAVLRQAVGGK